MKISLKSDYCELAHPAVLEALSAVGITQFEGYGLDEYSFRAAALIRNRIASPDADVHFVSGGTQANMLTISSMLRPHEAVIAAASGHVFVHEAGAIEATGHKVCAVQSPDGKLRAGDIEAIAQEHDDEHMVLPRLVYISQSTETGLVYTRQELTELSEMCKKHSLMLYVDGARLGSAMSSDACDLTYADIAAFADAFYVGGTKNGAIFGEAIVLVSDALKEDFRRLVKQRGALISKGASIGIQFETLFKDGLYDSIAKCANAKAAELARGIENAGYSFAYPVQTNMLFPVFPNAIAEKMHSHFDFYDWSKDGGKTTVRILTSWATPEHAISSFLSLL